MKIEASNVNYIYSKGTSFENVALKDVSLSAGSGEFVCIIGHTGSGKSTLLQALSGLAKPQSGSILADGVDIYGKSAEAKAARRRIGLIFQYPEYQLFEESVLKDVCFGPLNLGESPDDAKIHAENALSLVGIDKSKWNESPFALSGGQRRMAAIAGILAMEPKLLILDEPTAGLDPKAHQDVLDIISNIRKQYGTTIILVTHNMDDAANLADKIFVMHQGSIAMSGAPKEIFAHKKELEQMGLGLPSASAFLWKLKEKGLNVDTNIFTAKQAAAEIAKVLNGN